jgi:hypothetical protein
VNRSLTVLAADVRRAREEVQRLRGVPASAALHAAHESLLEAMERYAAALSVRHLPLPARLRDELRLQRRIGRNRGRYAS